MFDAARYPTALALSILSMEEAGKYYLVKWQNTPKKSGHDAPAAKGRHAHRQKQSVASTFHIAGSVKAFLREDVGRRLGLEGAASEQQVMAFFHAMSYHRDKPDSEFRALAVETEREIEVLLAKAIASSKGAALQQKAFQGEIDNLKQRVLYVDVSAEGKVVADPNSITKDNASEWIDNASVLVSKLGKP